jgi:hypothetical protein
MMSNRWMFLAVDKVRAEEHRALLKRDGESVLTRTRYDWLRNSENRDNRGHVFGEEFAQDSPSVGDQGSGFETLDLCAIGMGGKIMERPQRMDSTMSDRANEKSRTEA